MTEGQDELIRLYEAYMDGSDEQKNDVQQGMKNLWQARYENPRHERFYKNVKTVVEGILRQEPDEAESCSVLSYMLQAQEGVSKKERTYYMLTAAHGLGIGLVSFLAQEDALRLAQQYEQMFPKRERTPVQRDMLKALQKRGKGKT